MGTQSQKSKAYNYKEFVKVVYYYPNGLLVELSNGLGDVVIRQNKSFPQPPVVKINNGDNSNYINLMENLNLFIEAVTI